jgi:hypothetical protein
MDPVMAGTAAKIASADKVFDLRQISGDTFTIVLVGGFYETAAAANFTGPVTLQGMPVGFAETDNAPQHVVRWAHMGPRNPEFPIQKEEGAR